MQVRSIQNNRLLSSVIYNSFHVFLTRRPGLWKRAHPFILPTNDDEQRIPRVLFISLLPRAQCRCFFIYIFFYIYIYIYTHSLIKNTEDTPSSIHVYCIFLFFCVHCFRHAYANFSCHQVTGCFVYRCFFLLKRIYTHQRVSPKSYAGKWNTAEETDFDLAPFPCIKLNSFSKKSL